MSPITRRGVLRIGAGSSGMAGSEKGHTLDLLEEDHIQMMVPVPYTRDEDIPMHMRQHTNDGRGRFTRLLYKVAQVVLCYNEHHHDD